MTINVFHHCRDGQARTHTVTNFHPTAHRADEDNVAYWVPEIISVGETAARACSGKLKPVRPVRDERICPGASSDAAPVHGSFAEGLEEEGGEG